MPRNDVANGFVKQAFANFKSLGPVGLKIGRFAYFDGLEVKPKDAMLAGIVQSLGRRVMAFLV